MSVGDIASIPLWLLTVTFGIMGLICPFYRRPGETDADLAGQFIVGLIGMAVFAPLAAACMKYL